MKMVMMLIKNYISCPMDDKGDDIDDADDDEGGGCSDTANGDDDDHHLVKYHPHLTSPEHGAKHPSEAIWKHRSNAGRL